MSVLDDLDFPEDKPCPKCGGETTFGFGLAGGGYGAYRLCMADGCDYFEKRQSGPEEDS